MFESEYDWVFNLTTVKDCFYDEATKEKFVQGMYKCFHDNFEKQFSKHFTTAFRSVTVDTVRISVTRNVNAGDLGFEYELLKEILQLYEATENELNRIIRNNVNKFTNVPLMDFLLYDNVKFVPLGVSADNVYDIKLKRLSREYLENWVKKYYKEAD